MVTYSAVLSRQTVDGDVFHAVAGFYSYDDAVEYVSDWPGRADIVDFATGELLVTFIFDTEGAS